MPYRITDKENAHLNGRPVTMFTLWEGKARLEGYVHKGRFAANGHDASDDACIQHALDVLDPETAED